MGKITKSLTIGAILGFLGGLLFAPQKGDETRKKVKEMVDQGKGKLEELKETLNKKEE
jgi:gas vesicle protein